jgi:BirA family biotin operon repressor/biotin-[acetyl-CoA-carboxylase] ligase
MNSAPILPPDYELLTYETLDSAVDEAMRLAARGAEEGTLVWAKQQSAGHGRFGHPWISPPGNLYCALILRLEEPAETALQVNYVAAVSLGAAVAELLGPAALQYRWPNDLLVGGSKVGGLLLAASPRNSAGAFDWLVLGVAVNVATQPINVNATALAPFSDRLEGVSEADVLEGFARHFLSWINRWAEEGFAAVHKAWTVRASDVGQPVAIQLAQAVLEGRFAELDTAGALVLALPGETRRLVTIGEFFSI